MSRRLTATWWQKPLSLPFTFQKLRLKYFKRNKSHFKDSPVCMHKSGGQIEIWEGSYVAVA